MSGAIPFLAAVAMFVSIFALVVWFGARAMKRQAAAMARLAERTGLTVVEAGSWMKSPRVAGEVRGKRAEFFSYSTGSGKSRKTWAAIRVRPAQAGGFEFSIRRQGFVTKVSEFFGAKEILVGDRAFDERWFIRSNRPEFFRAALLPELREKIDAAERAGAKGEFKLEAGVVAYAEQGTFTDERCVRYEALLTLLCDLADVAEVAAAG